MGTLGVKMGVMVGVSVHVGGAGGTMGVKVRAGGMEVGDSAAKVGKGGGMGVGERGRGVDSRVGAGRLQASISNSTRANPIRFIGILLSGRKYHCLPGVAMVRRGKVLLINFIEIPFHYTAFLGCLSKKKEWDGSRRANGGGSRQ
jgi:hypothetical protein